jgi:oligopeptide/dipeptide ABC transporter ATP-binding protein
LLLISHDLAAVCALAERAAVLYTGKLVEAGDTPGVLERPRYPDTWELLNAYPTMSTARDLRPICGGLPDPTDPPLGCRFHPRCTRPLPAAGRTSRRYSLSLLTGGEAGDEVDCLPPGGLQRCCGLTVCAMPFPSAGWPLRPG